MYKAPNCGVYPVFNAPINCMNTLLCGNQGSGKSTFEDGMIYNIANRYTPAEAELYLIDPKMVELRKWTVLPHVKGYARTVDESMTLMDYIVMVMMERYDEMASDSWKTRKYNGSHIYLFIDELADLMLEAKKDTTFKLRKIMQMGRAANIHVVCCTQTPSRLSIPAAAQINFDCRVGLRLDDKIDSRQAIKQNGCEKLDVGECYLKIPSGITKEKVPMYSDKHIEGMRNYWIAQRMKGAM